MMRKISFFAMSVASAAAMWSAAGRAVAADDKVAAADKERQLIAVIQSDAPPQDKAIPCKQLAIYGTKAAVPALAALLPNKDLSSWARIALEAIPDPAADDALREAMGKVQGRLLIGVINSLGVRRDAKAADALAGKLKDADAEVASAAAEALGRIGGDGPAKALSQSLASAPPAVRSAAAYGCILCAERFLAEGQADRAVAIYDAVGKADVPRQRHLEAIRGAILSRGPAGVGMLAEQLQSKDKTLFALGMQTAREIPGPEVAAALAAEMKKATPDRKIMLLMALADRGGPEALPAVLDAAKSGEGKLRVMAVAELDRLGDATCVPVLLDAAVEADEELAKTAKTALGRLSGEKVDADLLARLAKASGKLRQVLLELAGRRRIEAALPTMVAGMADADTGVRAAAVAAIGVMGGGKQVADLVAVCQKTADAKEREGIEKALLSVSVRGGSACVPQLMPLVRSEEGGLRAIGVHSLACAGGSDALTAVAAAIDDKDASVADEAARTLSTWPNQWPDDEGAAGPLLALTKSGKKVSHRVLGLRGYLQYLQGAKTLDDEAKLAKIKEVLELITRPDEKKRAIAVLEKIRAGGALDVLVGFAGEPAVAEEACSAIAALAGRGDLKGATKDQRREALRTAVAKSRSDRTKKRAEQALRGIK